MFCFCSRTLSYHMYLSCLFRLLLSVTVSRTFLVFDDLDSFENIGQVFCRMAFLWNLADVFLIPGLELQSFGGKIIEVKCPSRPVCLGSMLTILGVSLDPGCCSFVRFLHCKAILFPLSILYFLEESLSVHTWTWEFMFPPEDRASTCIIWNFMAQEMYLLSHLFISSITYLYRHGSQMFILYLGLYSNTTLFILFFSNCSSFGHYKLFEQAPVVFVSHQPISPSLFILLQVLPDIY